MNKKPLDDLLGKRRLLDTQQYKPAAEVGRISARYIIRFVREQIPSVCPLSVASGYLQRIFLQRKLLFAVDADIDDSRLTILHNFHALFERRL